MSDLFRIEDLKATGLKTDETISRPQWQKFGDAVDKLLKIDTTFTDLILSKGDHVGRVLQEASKQPRDITGRTLATLITYIIIDQKLVSATSPLKPHDLVDLTTFLSTICDDNVSSKQAEEYSRCIRYVQTVAGKGKLKEDFEGIDLSYRFGEGFPILGISIENQPRKSSIDFKDFQSTYLKPRADQLLGAKRTMGIETKINIPLQYYDPDAWNDYLKLKNDETLNPYVHEEREELHRVLTRKFWIDDLLPFEELDVFLIGPGGTGKSMFIVDIFSKAADDEVNIFNPYWPIYIELSNEKDDIVSQISRSLEIFGLSLVMISNPLFLILDGLDEYRGDENLLFKQITELRASRDIKVLMSSRRKPKHVPNRKLFRYYQMATLMDFEVEQIIVHELRPFNVPWASLQKIQSSVNRASLEIPLFLDYWLFVLKDILANRPGEIEKQLGQLNDARILKYALVDSFILNYEHKSSQLDESSWKVLKNHQINVLGEWAHIMIENNCANFLELEVVYHIHSTYCSNKPTFNQECQQTISDVRQHGIVLFNDKGIRFSHQELRDFFFSLRLTNAATDSANIAKLVCSPEELRKSSNQSKLESVQRYYNRLLPVSSLSNSLYEHLNGDMLWFDQEAKDLLTILRVVAGTGDFNLTSTGKVPTLFYKALVRITNQHLAFKSKFPILKHVLVLMLQFGSTRSLLLRHIRNKEGALNSFVQLEDLSMTSIWQANVNFIDLIADLKVYASFSQLLDLVSELPDNSSRDGLTHKLLSEDFQRSAPTDSDEDRGLSLTYLSTGVLHPEIQTKGSWFAHIPMWAFVAKTIEINPNQFWRSLINLSQDTKQSVLETISDKMWRLYEGNDCWYTQNIDLMETSTARFVVEFYTNHLVQLSQEATRDRNIILEFLILNAQSSHRREVLDILDEITSSSQLSAYHKFLMDSLCQIFEPHVNEIKRILRKATAIRNGEGAEFNLLVEVLSTDSELVFSKHLLKELTDLVKENLNDLAKLEEILAPLHHSTFEAKELDQLVLNFAVQMDRQNTFSGVILDYLGTRGVSEINLILMKEMLSADPIRVSYAYSNLCLLDTAYASTVAPLVSQHGYDALLELKDIEDHKVNFDDEDHLKNVLLRCARLGEQIHFDIIDNFDWPILGGQVRKWLYNEMRMFQHRLMVMELNPALGKTVPYVPSYAINLNRAWYYNQLRADGKL